MTRDQMQQAIVDSLLESERMETAEEVELRLDLSPGTLTADYVIEHEIVFEKVTVA